MLQWIWRPVSRTPRWASIRAAAESKQREAKVFVSTIAPKWSQPDTPIAKVILPGGTNAPRLGGAQKPLSRGFLSNLKDFLTERPIKLSKDARGQVFTVEEYGGGFTENIKEWFKPTPKAVSSRMILEQQPGYKIMLQNLRDLISPPKLPPLQVTSKPVKVKEIWSKDKAFGPSQAIALAVHIGVTVLVFSPLLYSVAKKVAATPTTSIVTPLDISPYETKLPSGKDRAGGGGGGGERNPIPATKGKAPKFSLNQIAPPMAHPKPDSQFQASLLGPPDLKIPSPNMDNYGDPLAKLLTTSGGPGGGSGIGSGTGTGIGSGSGGGLGPGSGGGTGGGAYRPGVGGVGYPDCFYKPEAKYSDEARKAKYQGTVTVRATVTVEGRMDDLHVMQGPGLGLEDQALEALRMWRCKPANGPNGKPVPVVVDVEVNFRLL